MVMAFGTYIYVHLRINSTSATINFSSTTTDIISNDVNASSLNLDCEYSTHIIPAND